MANVKVTNILLSLIAALLLIVVIQNSRPSHPDRDFPSDMMSGIPHAESDPGAPSGSGQPSMPAEGSQNQDTSEFHPASMIIGSLSCPNDASLTLSDTGCTGAEAETRRQMVENAMGQNLPISKVYDMVVAKFGEKALTESALQIRKNRKTAKKN